MSNKDNLKQFTENGLYMEYTKAVDPLRTGTISKVPFAQFDRSIHETGGTRLHPLDVSDKLGCEGPATSPSLCAYFVRIVGGESLVTNFNSTSQIFYVMYGEGKTEFDDVGIPWKKGDFVVLPAGNHASHIASKDSAFYLVNDEPLLKYLGARASNQRFKPTLYTSETALIELNKVRKEADAVNRSRISVLLLNKAMDQTLTVTHTLWAMLGMLPKDAVQLPHRHQSVALDLILDCDPGCYTLVGEAISSEGEIINPRRVDWKPFSSFITPPGYWHAHFNESSSEAHFIPMQDAGLHTYLRTLDIKFVLPQSSSC